MAPRLLAALLALSALTIAPSAHALEDPIPDPLSGCIAYLICSWEKVLTFCPLIDSGPGYVGYTRGAYNNFDGTWRCFYSGIGRP